MMNKIKKIAYSLAEMMIVMLILCIITAAMTPIITKSLENTGSEKFWQALTTNNGIYYGSAIAQKVSMGLQSLPTSPLGKVTINSDISNNQLALANDGTVYGFIKLNGGILLGNGTPTSTSGIVL